MYNFITRAILERRGTGHQYIRMMLGHFYVGSNLFNRHSVIIYQPAQTSLMELMRLYAPNGFPEATVKKVLRQVLQALDFCHTHANIIHCGMLPPRTPVLFFFWAAILTHVT